jgi:hypothetical protein
MLRLAAWLGMALLSSAEPSVRARHQMLQLADVRAWNHLDVAWAARVMGLPELAAKIQRYGVNGTALLEGKLGKPRQFRCAFASPNRTNAVRYVVCTQGQ